jgi:hypothetical protein
MLKLTWDTNCLYRLKDTNPKYKYDRRALNELLALRAAGEIEIRMAASSADENQEGGFYLEDIQPFLDGVEGAGLDPRDLTPGPAAFDFMRLNHSAFPGGEPDLRDLHAAMFDGVEYEEPQGLDETDHDWREWKNRRLDVHLYWSHLHGKGDLFVTTNTKDFVDDGRRERLLAFGGKGIEHPVTAPGWIRAERLAPHTD